MNDKHYQERPDAELMRQWRHELHQNPEIGFELPRTSAMVAKLLEGWGYEVTTGLAESGVVGRMSFGDPARGPVIGMRADMDALPITEATGLPYASTTPDAMHACGHDGHTAMLLGGAELMARRAAAGELVGNGTVVLIFQPAEEVGGSDSGAQRMIKEGLFEKFPCDAVFGIHNGPTEEEGHMHFRPGAFMCSSDTVTLRFKGSASHGATPHLARDAALAMSATVLALHSIVSRNLNPLDTGILSIGKLSSGTVFNVIPGEAELVLAVRALRPEVAARIHERIAEVTHAQAAAYGCTAEIVTDYGYPSVFNDPGMTSLATATAKRLFGEEMVEPEAEPVTASEDFAFYGLSCPSAFFILGNGVSGHRDGKPVGHVSVHNPHYDFNDKILPLGAEYWAGLAEDAFQQGALK